jgi:hypothetical protein
VITGHKRGHPVVFDDDHWRYEDGVLASAQERPCVKCGDTAEPGGPDPCLGLIPGIASACCGHGIEPGYAIARDPDALYVDGEAS